MLESCATRPEAYKKILFAVAWYHSVLLERRKFLTLGLNIPYDWNDSDFEVSLRLIANYIDATPEEEATPWGALRYLIAEINYGGRVTDERDLRLLRVYAAELFNEDLLTEPLFRLSLESQIYYVPEDGPLQAYQVRRPGSG